MGKRKPPRRITDREVQLQMPATQSTFVKSHKVLWAVLGAFGTLMTIVGFYLGYIVPKLSVDVSGSLEPANPMASVFVLSNEGTLPVHDVVAACGAIQFKAGKWEIGSEPDARVVFPESKAEILSPGHKMTLPCSHLIGIPAGLNISKAEITIIATYRQTGFPGTKRPDSLGKQRKQWMANGFGKAFRDKSGLVFTEDARQVREAEQRSRGGVVTQPIVGPLQATS